MTTNTAFSFIPIPTARSNHKPRKSGLNSIIDYGIPLGIQTDHLEIAGHLIDIAKIATATARTYDKEVLSRKLGAYREHNIRTQLGGQIAEYVFATSGIEGVKQLFVEARELGFDLIEVSDCCVPISHDNRRKLVRCARELNLHVVFEVGGYEGNADTARLVEDSEFALSLDVDYVIVEGSELIGADGFKREVVDTILRTTSVDQVIFEVPWPAISDASLGQIESVKRNLIQEFGPDVNLGNLVLEEIIETEAVRVGIEDHNSWPT